MKKSEKKLAKKLAARLDRGTIEPTDTDDAELENLLATFACLDDAIEEPNPKHRRWVRRLLKESSMREKVSAWVGRFRERWLAWLPSRYHRPLAWGAAVLIVVVLLAALLSPGRGGMPTPLRQEVATVPDEGEGVDELANQGSAYEATAAYHSSSRPGLFDGLFSRSDQSHVYYLEVADTDGDTGSTAWFAYDSMGRIVTRDGLSRETTAASASVKADGDTQNEPADDGSDRMIVRQAALALVVQDTEASFAHVQAIAGEQGGWIAGLESGKTAQGGLQTTVVIQVPVAAFEPVLNQLRAMDVELFSERVSSQDVTADYVDLAARVHNLELAEGEIQELLDSAQERGEKSREILNIYDELTDIREQIERLKGQMILLESSAAMSEIEVSLIPEEIAPEPPEPTGFDAGRVLQEAWAEVVQVFENIATALLRLLAYAPLILPPLLVAALVVWLIARRMRRSAAANKKEVA